MTDSKQAQLNELRDYFIKHDKEDGDRHNEILAEVEKYKKLFEQNGQHFSSFSKTLNEIRDEQGKMNERQVKIYEEFTTHTKRVEPVILSFEENEIFKRGASKWGKRVVGGASVVGAWYIIKAFIVGTLLK